MTLIEVMVAMSVLLVAMLGFVATTRFAATSTAVGHRRTVATFLRGRLIDRLAVTPRAALATIPATWVIDTCYDNTGQSIGDNYSDPLSPQYSATFTCPAGTYYQSWVQATPNQNYVNWAVNLYVERLDMSCTSASDTARSQRYGSEGCAAADLLLTN
jgi:Tfp pilus assembly protein PilV